MEGPEALPSRRPEGEEVGVGGGVGGLKAGGLQGRAEEGEVGLPLPPGPFGVGDSLPLVGEEGLGLLPGKPRLQKPPFRLLPVPGPEEGLEAGEGHLLGVRPGDEGDARRLSLP